MTRFGGSAVGLWLALTALGCGKTDANQQAPGGHEPGAEPRLVPWQLETEGSEPLVVGIFDRELEQHCSFVPDEQGELRCLPAPLTSFEPLNQFADQRCAQRLYRVPKDQAPAVRAAGGQLVTVPLRPAGCEQRHTLSWLTEVLPDAPRYVEFDSGCGVYSNSLTEFERETSVDFWAEEGSWYALSYATGTLEDGPLLQERVRLTKVVGSDGSRFARQLVDERWQKPCSLVDSTDALGCVTETIPDSTNFHVDSMCEGDTVWYAAACTDPAYIGNPSFGSTPEPMYALGERYTGPVFEDGKGCRETMFQPPNLPSFYVLGEPLDAQAVATLSWLDSGDGRLAVRGLRDDAGGLLPLSDALFGDLGSQRMGSGWGAPRPRFFDNQRGEGCSPVWTSEGEVRCVPSSAQIDPYDYGSFVDFECKTPAYLCLAEPCVGKDLVAMGYDEQGRYRATGRHEAVAVAGPEIWSDVTGECLVGAVGGLPFFAAGAVLPWDDYPLLTEVNGD